MAVVPPTAPTICRKPRRDIPWFIAAGNPADEIAHASIQGLCQFQGSNKTASLRDFVISTQASAAL
jgi:hypothetical protein